MKFHIVGNGESIDDILNGYDITFGARPLKRYISHTIETMVARAIIGGNFNNGYEITIDVVNDNLIVR